MTLKSAFFRKKWDLAFVKGGLDSVFSDKPLEFDVVENPYKDRWFADPFVLDVTEDKIFLLAEEFRFRQPKGRIAKLTIDRRTMTIEKFVILLECPTHLSFPNILRREGKIYVYPENANGGKQHIYEYDAENEKLVFVKTICEDAIWDACMTDILGKWQLYAVSQNDFILEVYNWDEAAGTFVHAQTLESDKKDNRMAGQLFEYHGVKYCPTQDGSRTYGGGVLLKQLKSTGDEVQLLPGKLIAPPAGSQWEGLHTLNEYNGVVVIDLKGWVHPAAQAMYRLFSRLKHKKQ